MNRLLRSLLMLSLVLAGATLVRAADDKTAATPFYPLVVGNTWSYRVGENRFSLKVAKIEEVGADKNKINAARIELIVNGKVTAFEHIAVKGDALVRVTYEGKNANPPIPFLKLPPQKGTSWPVASSIDGQKLTGTFTEGEEEITVPAGKFKTVTVTGKDLEVNGVKMTLTYYFAEKVGMVKQVIEYAGYKAVIELEKFEPAK